MTLKIPENLAGKSLLTLYDLRDEQMLELIDFAIDLKVAKNAGVRNHFLAGRNIAAVFEKSSTRTRCATAVAAYDEGAHVEYLGKNDIHLGKKESVADTARVLGRMFDGILFRGFEHRTVELLAEHAGIPVWNGLTDAAHPTQTLADLMTVKETFGDLAGLKMVFVGDGRNNVCNSLMLGCAKAGMDFVNCCPHQLSPSQVWIDRAQNAAERTGSRIVIDHDPISAVRGAHVVYTDVWVSMGEEDVFEERLALLRPYQVDMDMIDRTGNRERGRLMFLHCLPAFHNRETDLTRELGALEVTDDVFEADFSHVFAQAENRMHTIKAMMVSALARQ